MKTCTSCNIEKPLDEFFKKKQKYNLNGYQARCKACKKEWERNNYINNEKDKRTKNGYKEKDKISQKKWREKNQGVKNAHSAKYRAAKRNATPKWLSKDQLNQIKELYKQARKLTEETGIKHHVDHIHPLTNDNFSGLHVPWNLQILTEAENIKKSNILEG
jgi:flagellum-specific peptidoglycan hydrolase FlgJ